MGSYGLGFGGLAGKGEPGGEGAGHSRSRNPPFAGKSLTAAFGRLLRTGPFRLAQPAV